VIVVPAIDLRGGRCVRLVRGEKGSETVYGEDPAAMASFWQSEGASYLHVVDLDAAFGGSRQIRAIASVLHAVHVPVQVGGGVRDVEDFAALLDTGASRVVFGTVAVERPEVVEKALAKDADAVAVAVDVKRGSVCLRGWTERTDVGPSELGRRWATAGVGTFIYTETSRDGTGDGLDVEATERFARAMGKRTIASGGIGSLEHLRALSPLAAAGVEGVIVGRALYERSFTLEEAGRALRRC
jgi:phosphoribosylformimino-5-aminoimidazole carboxamide ribotide isomerase